MGRLTLDDRTRWRQALTERHPQLDDTQITHVLREIIRRASLPNTRDEQRLGEWLLAQPLSEIVSDAQYEVIKRLRSDRTERSFSAPEPFQQVFRRL